MTIDRNSCRVLRLHPLARVGILGCSAWMAALPVLVIEGRLSGMGMAIQPGWLALWAIIGWRAQGMNVTLTHETLVVSAFVNRYEFPRDQLISAHSEGAILLHDPTWPSGKSFVIPFFEHHNPMLFLIVDHNEAQMAEVNRWISSQGKFDPIP